MAQKHVVDTDQRPRCRVTAVLSPLWVAVPVARGTIAGASRLRAEREAVALIPRNASVSASNIIGAHLLARSRILLFPVVQGARWIAVDVRDTEGAASFRAAVAALRRHGSYRQLFDATGSSLCAATDNPAVGSALVSRSSIAIDATMGNPRTVAANAPSVQSWDLRAVQARRRSHALSASLSIRVVAIAYAAVFSAAGIVDYVGFRSAGYDLRNAV
jgi:hypothetical protein